MPSTHAGGIQPSSSFFHPRPPAQQLQYSPQPSFVEHPDDYPLAELPAATHDDRPTKPSREPLLPSLVRPPSPRRTAAGRVRTSIDRVFGLARAHTPDSGFVPDEERADHSSFSRHSHSHSFSKSQPVSESPIRCFAVDDIVAPSVRSRSSLQSQGSPSSPTPPPSFIVAPPPLDPAHPYPPARTPAVKPGTTRPLKRYHLYPSHNRFFFGGRLLTGGDSPWAFIASLSLVVFLSAIWFSTTCVFWWHHAHSTKAIVIVGAYLTALVFSTMITTASTDPGILPRDLDLDPPYPATSPSDGGLRAPLPRDLRVRNQVVRVKYCATCKIYRPPRSSHCKMCDNCVDDCDHHCQWVNNCIGRRNYTTFFALITFATMTLILVIITTALHLRLLTQKGLTFRHALSEKKGVGSAIVFSIAIIILWPILALFAYHFRLLMLNSTTIEQIRNQAHKTIDPGGEKPKNPFSHGTRRRNIAAVLCRPAGYSWLDAPAYATEDCRAINPGRMIVDADVDVPVEDTTMV